MSTHANMVKMTVASVAGGGTGTITLNAASTGYRSLGTAYGADATVDILITEGATWEVARNCTYTHSGTTVNRGTLESSSTGSAVAFTSAAVVSVVATAAFGNNAALAEVSASPTTAGVTGVVGTMHVLDISGLTADRNFTLPATAAVGDRVGVYLTTGDATYELIIIGDTGDTINGGAAATEWSRLFITNECVILRCITADAAWVVEHDGRIPQQGFLRLSTAATGETASTWTQPTTRSGAWTADVDIGSVCDTANDRIIPRRLGNYSISATYIANSVTSASNKSHGVGLYIDSSAGTLITNVTTMMSFSGGRGQAVLAINAYKLPSLGNGICYTFFSDEGSRGALTSGSATTPRNYLSVVEVL